MDIFTMEIEGYYILFKINLTAAIIIIIVSVLLYLLLRRRLREFDIIVNEVNVGISENCNVKYQICDEDRQIAFKIWTEIKTRKIGILFDEKDDTIIEVYNSWYEFFKITREHVKSVPVRKLLSKSEKNVATLSISVLNDVIRPHLTKYQSRFRSWYDNERLMNPGVPPQELQKRYPDYNELVADIKSVNAKILYYSDELNKIAYRKDK